MLLMYLSQAINAVFPLLIAPLVVRKAGVPEFGSYSLMLVASQAALLVSEYSFDAVGPRLLAAKPRNVAESDIGRAVLRNKLALFPLALLVWISGCVMLRIEITLPAFAGGVLVLLGTALQANWYLVATHRAKYVAIFNLLGRLVALTLIVAALSLKLGPGWLLFGTGAGMFAAGAVVSVKTLGFQTRTSLMPSVSLLGQGRSAFLATAGASLQNLVGVGLAGMLGGASGAGAYAATDRIARSASGSLKPFFLTIYPRMAKMHVDSPAKATRLAALMAAIWLIAAAPLVLATYLWGEKLLLLLYGQPIPGAAPILTILVGWLAFGVANNFLGIQGLLAGGRDRQYLHAIWSGLAMTALFAGACLLLRLPVVDAALAVLVGEAVVFVALALKFWNMR